MIRDFLGRHGLDPASAQVQALLGDTMRTRRSVPLPSARRGSRFVINQTLVVRSTEPEKIPAATEKVGELVEAGVVLSSEAATTARAAPPTSTRASTRSSPT